MRDHSTMPDNEYRTLQYSSRQSYSIQEMADNYRVPVDDVLDNLHQAQQLKEMTKAYMQQRLHTKL